MEFPAEVTQLLAEVAADPTYTRYQSVGRALGKMAWGQLTFPEERRLRVALLSSFTLEPLVPLLQVGCLQAGLVPEFYVGGFNQYCQALLDPASALYAFKPDLVFAAIELSSLVPDADQAAPAPAAVEQVLALVEAFKRQAAGGMLVLANFIPPVDFPYTPQAARAGTAVEQINQALAAALSGERQVLLAPVDRLAAYHGLARVANPKLKVLAGMAWGESFLPQVAQLLLGYVKALRRQTRKCLVLDLDNTLWGGVVGEDGLAGLRLGPEGLGRAYLELQRVILQLHHQGVILALNSKNNPADALEALRTHPHMLLREPHFASLQLNWDDKVTNLRRIAAELNLGLDSLVFVDDSPQERLLVQQQLPEVLTVALPAEPALFAACLTGLNDFAQLFPTEEDRQRGREYAAQRSRRELQTQAVSLEAYLDSLQMKLVIRLAGPADFDRVYQLFQRTNQFNLTNRRYDPAELARRLAAAEYGVYTLRVADIFGESGLTGAVMLRRQSAVWELENLVLSCRVMGRTVEYELLNQIARDARAQGVAALRGEFCPSAKNQAAAEMYARAGFRRLVETPAGSQWELCLDSEGGAPTARFEVQR